jgi:hypothetical protein
VGAKLSYADGNTDGRTDGRANKQRDTTKLKVTFHNFANAPK